MAIENNSGSATARVICEIPMKLPSLNEYINACRGNKYSGAKMKKDLERDISLFITRIPKMTGPVKIHFIWVEKNTKYKKRDLDNIAFGKKFILDALVKCGKLKDDNRNCVTSFTDSFEYSDENKVVLIIESV